MAARLWSGAVSALQPALHETQAQAPTTAPGSWSSLCRSRGEPLPAVTTTRPQRARIGRAIRAASKRAAGGPALVHRTGEDLVAANDSARTLAWPPASCRGHRAEKAGAEGGGRATLRRHGPLGPGQPRAREPVGKHGTQTAGCSPGAYYRAELRRGLGGRMDISRHIYYLSTSTPCLYI